MSSTSRLEIIKGGGGGVEVQKIKILASSACVYVIMNGPWLPKVWPSGTSTATLNKTIWLLKNIQFDTEIQ